MSDGPAIPAYGERRAMPAESFIETASRIDLDAQMKRVAPDFVRELQAERERVVKIAPRLLEDELRPLLEWILDITLRQPVFLPGLGEQSTAYCALREGQNQIAWRLLQAIAEGREERLGQRGGL